MTIKFINISIAKYRRIRACVFALHFVGLPYSIQFTSGHEDVISVAATISGNRVSRTATSNVQKVEENSDLPLSLSLRPAARLLPSRHI